MRTSGPVDLRASRSGSAGWALTALLCVAAAISVVVAGARSSSESDAAVPVAPTTTTVPGDPDAPAYLTIVIGRTEWVATQACRPLTGAVPLDRVATALEERGLRATAGVVPSQTTDARSCDDLFAIRAGWDDLAMLRDRFGWGVMVRSAGDVAALDESAQRAETCGARDQLVARGHLGAWGLFAYADNARDEAVQRSVVQECFAFGRSYGSGVNVDGRLAEPWWQTTRSVNGGQRYDPPAELIEVARAEPGTWSVLQFYRFVEGTSTEGSGWDCTDPDPQHHWTGRAELYCFDDFLAVLDAVPDEVEVTDPATVATAWERLPPG